MVMRENPRRVSILAVPESMATPIHGLYETLMMLELVANSGGEGGSRLFDVEIVGPAPGMLHGACGLPLDVHKEVSEIDHTDIVIMTSMFFGEEWVTGRYPGVVEWLVAMHAGGADLCSACAGALLLAETGLLDGREATTHWAFAPTFQRNFPQVRLRIEELLITTGSNQEFVMSGAASSWQDLILYLIARHFSPGAARDLGKFLLYPGHSDTQAPYIPFSPTDNHGDAVVRTVQKWVQENYSVANPVEEMVRRSGLPESSFKRRFRNATGHSPLQYVQNLRIESAKRMLESSDKPVDEIGWAAGYEEPAFFRQLFKRITHLTPRQYRRKFRIPAAA